MRTIGYRSQRSLASSRKVEGVGFVTGTPVTVRFHPAPPDTGIVFRRTDLPGQPEIPALAEAVTDTQRRTTLGPASLGLTLIEHVMSALSGLRVDNCVVEIDGPEPPGLDGSARGFVDALLDAKIVLQPARRPIMTPNKTMTIAARGATISLHPSETIGLTATYFLNYGLHAEIPRQSFTTTVRAENFIREVVDCRTFLTKAEAFELRAKGVGRHLAAADVLVFDSHGVIDNTLRFADEPARHKVLDLIGDLALCGFDLAGHVVAYRSGHSLNVELARRLLIASDAAKTLPVPARAATFRRAA